MSTDPSVLRRNVRRDARKSKKTALPQLREPRTNRERLLQRWRMSHPTTDIEIIELFQVHASVPTNQHTFRTRNPHDSRIAAETPRGKVRWGTRL